MSDQEVGQEWTSKRRGTTAIDLRKNSEKDKAWARVKENQRAVEEELRVCKKQGRKTERYRNLTKDGAKLKEEFEKLEGKGTFDPNSHAQADAATVRKFLGDKR